ncbi:hypothetical protein N8376_05160 [Flavobacteriaceae bacterium]|nr:hypothetical protein [Flavobacteriaceae bacterium]
MIKEYLMLLDHISLLSLKYSFISTLVKDTGVGVISVSRTGKGYDREQEI